MKDFASKDKIKAQVLNIINKNYHDLDITRKQDRSLVTQVDTEVSLLFEEYVDKNLEGWKSLSEENADSHEVSFPLMILDPIDGTRGLVDGVAESVVSAGFMASESIEDPRNSAWIFNPFTGLDIFSEDQFIPSRTVNTTSLQGLVSRSEWNKGKFSEMNLEDKIIAPRGSIAFKLGLLAVGGCDFVLSMSPKNIWDIAAGTLLCHRVGIHFYNKDGIVEKFKDCLIKGPMLWCHEKNYSQLKGLIKDELES
jgi:myo-inositol-1(or 4)-monophosphatase